MRRPIVAASDKEVVAALVANPGAIGVMRSNLVASAVGAIAVVQMF
jgi:hypothetical protein